jgi:hypothetical protein
MISSSPASISHLEKKQDYKAVVYKMRTPHIESFAANAVAVAAVAVVLCQEEPCNPCC